MCTIKLKQVRVSMPPFKKTVATKKKKTIPKSAIKKTSPPKKRDPAKLNLKKMAAVQKKIHTLLNHERNKWIYKRDCGMGKVAFAVSKPPANKEILFSGLTKRLKQVLYPDTQENPMMRSKQDHRAHRYYAPRIRKKEKTSFCNMSGSDHGRLVHGQLDYYIKKLQTNRTLTIDQCFPNGTYDKCVLSILNLFHIKQWDVVATEHAIADDTCRVATAIDIVVFEKTTNKMILLELKTGYESEEYGAHPDDPMFPSPFDKYANCPKNRHMLQVMGMKEILSRQYHIHVDESYILRILPNSNSRAVVVKLAPWAKEKKNRDNLYELLCASE